MTYALLVVIECWYDNKPIGLTSQTFAFSDHYRATEAERMLKESLKDDITLRVFTHLLETGI